MGSEPVTYDASHITVLEGLEAVRKRPGMYIGSTGERGLHHMVFEAVTRALDEILAGSASRVEVTLMADGGVRVAHDGPGVPFEGGLEVLLTRLSCGRSAVRRRNLLDWFGLELSVVNALSSRLVAEARRAGRRQVQEYVRGVPVASPADAGSADDTGTFITFWPDPEILETVQCSFETLAERFRELAFLNRELDISLTDERGAELRSLRFCFPGGVREMVADVSDVISFELDEAGMAGEMEIAWQWHGSGSEQVRSFANSRPTPEGGTHVLGFRDGLAAALTALDPDIDADRIGEGLAAVVSVKLDNPEFEGCTRGRLGNAEVRGYVRQAVQEHFGRWLAEHPRQAAEIRDRFAAGTAQIAAG